MSNVVAVDESLAPSEPPARDRFPLWEQALSDFSEMCRTTPFPDVAAIRVALSRFPTDAQDDVLVDLVAIHLRKGWEQGQRTVLEDYVAEFGGQYLEFASLADIPVDLVEIEFVSRHGIGRRCDHPQLASYEQRFPGRIDIRTRLEELFVGEGRYVRLRLSGRGGEGQVWEAYDVRLGRPVAIKQPLSGLALSNLRLAREAQFAARLDHPGIITVHDVVGDTDPPLYVMRLRKGPTLDAAIQAFYADRGRLGPSECRVAFGRLLEAFVAICDAVHYAHQHGIIHRDIKPANVLLPAPGETLVIDWGLAASVWEPDGSGAEDWSAGMGSPGYVAPEQEMGTGTERSDIYSLGVVLCAILTGKDPSPGSVNLPAPSRLWPRRDAALRAVCRKAMAPDPASRYASAESLAEDIRLFRAGEPVSAWREPLQLRVGRWLGRHKVWVAVCLGGMALLGTGKWGMDRYNLARSAQSGIWEVPPVPPTRAERHTEKDDVFQDFEEDFILQRSWADPRFPGSQISAWVVPSPLADVPGRKALLVQFCRWGWGCDLTFKPYNNVQCDVRSYRYLVLNVLADPESLHALKAKGKQGLSIRVRVADEWGRQWAWGSPTGSEGDVVYHRMDANGQRLALGSDRPQEFSFDISRLQRWTHWNVEGAVAPNLGLDARFQHLQLVVIEPGIARDVEAIRPDDPPGHNRLMDDSPDQELSSFYVLGIHFRR